MTKFYRRHLAKQQQQKQRCDCSECASSAAAAAAAATATAEGNKVVQEQNGGQNGAPHGALMRL